MLQKNYIMAILTGSSQQKLKYSHKVE